MDKDLLELNLQKLPFPNCQHRGIFLKGCLFSASPIDSKPKNTTGKKWSKTVLISATQQANSKLAILRSFWPMKWGNNPLEDALDEIIIQLNDTFEPNDYYWGTTPIGAACEVIKALKNGENVIIPTLNNKVPGFLYALLDFILNDYVEQPHKLCATLSQYYDFEITPLQIGYCYGFYDRERIWAELALNELKGTRYDK